ncbi:MAG: glycosyltransferase family 2 protein [Planctomycetes bacterium]|nr:glycosyltransferase family 2 protein [Planctomycetota bacterium]
MALRISAIVPTLNEEEGIAGTLASLRQAGLDEVVVVDGGSRDATAALARAQADRVLEALGGLFAQLNRGAAEARGDVLVFHYADVDFPAAGRAAIEGAFESGGLAGGAFALGFRSPLLRYAVIARGAGLRNRLGVGPFGDQSIFARAEVFRRIGGYRPGAFLEDLDLVRRLKREGAFRILGERVRASVRRWERNGVVPTLLEHWKLTLLYLAGRGRAASEAARAARDLRTVR